MLRDPTAGDRKGRPYEIEFPILRRAACPHAAAIPYMKCGGAGRCGERTERCQWQKKRGERVAAVKISSVRRKAAQKFWAPQQDHRPLRNSL